MELPCDDHTGGGPARWARAWRDRWRSRDGAVGQLVVQYLLLSGARKVIAMDAVQGRLDMAKAHGATHVLNVNVKDARSRSKT